jgi:hypothetical protein
MPKDIIHKLFSNSFKQYIILKKKTPTQIFDINTKLEIPQIFHDQYIDSKICQIIRQTLHFKSETDYSFDNTKITLIIYHEINDKQTRKSIDKIIDVLNYYVFTLNKLHHRNAIHITLYLTDVPKTFPATQNTIIGSFHVNSGYSILDSSNNNFSIVIYRKEELLKVLLHELIHCWNIMFHSYDVQYDYFFIQKYQITVIDNKHKTNTLALYECFTDILACYGHLLTSLLFGNTKDMENLEKLIQKEKRHMCSQANKIWNFTKRKESTHCFSYYVCKAALFNRLDLYRKFVFKHGLSLIDASKTHEALELLRVVLEGEDFQKNLNKPIQNILKLSHMSLRMTSVRF